jgi:hypothetical protein
MVHREAELQTACIRWFRYQYPKLAPIMFAVPNGGSRNLREAMRLKEQGVVSGVSDLILLKPNSQYSSLCIEMKADKGRQTGNQKHFQKVAEEAGNRYVVIRSFDEFRETVISYLNGNGN